MIDKHSLLLKLTPPNWNATQKEQNEYVAKLGEEGERLTREILDNWGTMYFSIEQNKNTKPKWISNIDGKRPDFIVLAEDKNTIIFIDSKFYKNYNGYFFLSTLEVIQNKALVNHLGNTGIHVEFLFIFPIGGMAGHNFFAYTLEEADSADEVLIEATPYKKLQANQAFRA